MAAVIIVVGCVGSWCWGAVSTVCGAIMPPGARAVGAVAVVAVVAVAGAPVVVGAGPVADSVGLRSVVWIISGCWGSLMSVYSGGKKALKPEIKWGAPSKSSFTLFITPLVLTL